MKRDCSTCICKEGSCYPSTTIFDKDKTCKSYTPDYEGYITDLEKENAELKADNAEWGKASDKWKNVYELTNNQLTKAKELLNMFLRLHYSPIVDEATLCHKVEQFLNSEVEK